MPNYTSPASSIVGYEIELDPDIQEVFGDVRDTDASVLTRSARSLLNVGGFRASITINTGVSDRIRAVGASPFRSRLDTFARTIERQGESFTRAFREAFEAQATLQLLESFQRAFSRGGFGLRVFGVTALVITFSISRSQLRRARREYRRALSALNRAARRYHGSITAHRRYVERVEAEYDGIIRGSRSYFGGELDGLAERIYVEYNDSSIYRWSASTIGDGGIETMIRLAEANRGLNSWIHNNVRLRYG